MDKNKLKIEILNIIESLDKIIIGEVQQKISSFVSFTEIKEALEELREEGYIKGSSRMGYINTMRFECTCECCKRKFMSISKEHNVCYDCSRIIQVKIEREGCLKHMKASEKPTTMRWGNLEENWR